MTILSRDDLAHRAGIDPWNLLAKLHTGDPAEIDTLAAAFYRAAGDAKHAHTATVASLRYVRDGYSVDQASPIDASAEAARTKKTLGTMSDHLPQIAKVLTGVGGHLAQATKQATIDVEHLDSGIASIERSWDAFMAGTGSHLPDTDLEPIRQRRIAEAVALVRTHGHTVTGFITDYEGTLGNSLKSLADLGYLPPDALDEGPGDLDRPDAKTAGHNTIAAIKLPDGKSVHYLNVSTQYLDLLIRKAQSGVHLTATDKAWLKAYYAEVTPHLAELKTWGDHHAHVSANGVPNPKLPSTKALAVVGDGFLTLTRNVPYAQLPASARDVLDGHVGTTKPEPGSTHGHGRRLDTWPPTSANGKPDPTLTGFGTLTGFLDHYSHTNQTAGTGFENHVVDAAIRYKHELNVIYENGKARIADANAGHDIGVDDIHIMSKKQYNQLYSDIGSSEGLDLVSRDHPFTNHLLHTDPATRRTIMGLNWDHGQGAAHVLLSGTLPGHGVSAHDAAVSALDVVRDAGSGYDGLAHMANHDVKVAIAGVGAAYIDSFAVQPGGFGVHNGQGGVGMITIPGGGKVMGLHMDDATYANYLKYIADSDPKIYANFQTLADQRGIFYVSNALQHGGVGSDAYRQAIEYTSQLSGGLEGAAPAVLRDIPTDHAHSDERKLAQEQLQYASNLHAYERDQMLSGSATTAIGLTPFQSVLDVGDTVAGLAGQGSLGDMLGQGAPDGVDLPKYIHNLQSYVEQLGEAQGKSAIALGNAHDHLAGTVAAANASLGHPIIDPTTGAPVVRGADGRWPAIARSHALDGINSADADAMADAINIEYGSSTATNYGPGHKANDQWATGTAPERGSLSDSGGNWSNEDDNYKILYGNGERYVWHDGDYHRSNPND